MEAECTIVPTDTIRPPTVLQTAIRQAEEAAKKARWWRARAAGAFALGLLSGLGLALLAFVAGGLS